MEKDLPQISIATTDGGNFGAYLALPETTPAPAVICIQEVYGVNRFMRGGPATAPAGRRCPAGADSAETFGR